MAPSPIATMVAAWSCVTTPEMTPAALTAMAKIAHRIGMRHFEIYNNSFLLPDKTCPGGSNTSLSNINQFIWIRGGTGVIYNNNFDHLSTSCWGTKTEIKLSNRGAEDDRPQGTCSATHYPVPHQIGQSNNGSSDFTDPIWFWGNNGAMIEVAGSWAWGNPCAFNWNTFFQWGRDAVNTDVASIVLSLTGGSVSGLGGSTKARLYRIHIPASAGARIYFIKRPGGSVEPVGYHSVVCTWASLIPLRRSPEPPLPG